MRQNQSQRNERMDRYEGSSYRSPRDMSSSGRSEWEFDRPDRVEASRRDRSRSSQDEDRSQGYRTDRFDRSDRDLGSRSYSSPREERSNYGAGTSYSGTTGTTYGSYGRDEYGTSGSNTNYGSSRGASFDRNDRGYQGYDRNESDLEGRGYESSGRLAGSYSSSSSGLRSDRGDRSEFSRSEGRTSFAGRGPKGYKRSDDRIKEDVSEMLSRDHNVDASDIEVEVKDGEVTLTGSIPERNMKHLAEECAERTSGVRDVINQLRVKRESTGETSSESASRSSSMGSSSTSTGTSGSTSGKRSSTSSTSLS
jgi:osmotically-inducible protein OsmY